MSSSSNIALRMQKSVTKSQKAQTRATASLLQIPGFLVQSVIGAVAAHPADLPDALRRKRRSGWSEQLPAAMALDEFDNLLVGLSKHFADPAFGLQLGKRIKEANLHLIGPLITSSRSLRDALENLRPVQSSLFGAELWQLQEENAIGRYTCTRSFFRPMTMQLTLALMFCTTERFVPAPHNKDVAVHFKDAAPDDLDPYRQLFGHRVFFGASQYCVSFPARLLDLRRPGTDPEVSIMLRQLATSRYVAEQSSESWTAQLEAVLRGHNNLANVEFAQLAEHMGLSLRRLRSHLRDEGESTTSVLNRMRFERASALLEGGSTSIREVAEMMGYSEASAFMRAFRRWSGRGAAEFRAEKRRP